MCANPIYLSILGFRGNTKSETKMSAWLELGKSFSAGGGGGGGVADGAKRTPALGWGAGGRGPQTGGKPGGHRTGGNRGGRKTGGAKARGAPAPAAP